MSFLKEKPHRRYNPLKEEWVLVSPHRTKRPWKGQKESTGKEPAKTYEPDCYLCPRNTRANGEVNPDYDSVFVFQNDFAALLPEKNSESMENGLFRAQTVSGESRVMCFSPKHHLTLPRMGISEIERVIAEWQKQTEELKARYKYVQIFENKGAVMGCSNPHPHCQIWVSDFLPNEPEKEEKAQANYFQKNGKVLLQEYAEIELKEKARVVISNEDWVAVVPFWAVWPFEILLLPLFDARDFTDLNPARRKNLSEILKTLLIKYDNLFQTSFPYSMGWHQSPGGSDDRHSLLHAHFYPPLLRSATVKKFMVGYEMLAESQRDILPETAAEMLQNLSKKHYED